MDIPCFSMGAPITNGRQQIVLEESVSIKSGVKSAQGITFFFMFSLPYCYINLPLATLLSDIVKFIIIINIVS